jgi:hypothetical protein
MVSCGQVVAAPDEPPTASVDLQGIQEADDLPTLYSKLAEAAQSGAGEEFAGLLRIRLDERSYLVTDGIERRFGNVSLEERHTIKVVGSRASEKGVLLEAAPGSRVALVIMTPDEVASASGTHEADLRSGTVEGFFAPPFLYSDEEGYSHTDGAGFKFIYLLDASGVRWTFDQETPMLFSVGKITFEADSSESFVEFTPLGVLLHNVKMRQAPE